MHLLFVNIDVLICIFLCLLKEKNESGMLNIWICFLCLAGNNSHAIHSTVLMHFAHLAVCFGSQLIISVEHTHTHILL